MTVSTANKVYLVTGANAGLGLEATRQLALKADTKKVYLACRTKSKALQAIEDLSNQYKIDSTKLEYIHFDASKSKEDIVSNLVDTLKLYPNANKLHGLILNAGGVGHDSTGLPQGPNHILDIFQLNLLGHIHMVEGLKSREYFIPNQTVIVMAGSEAARGVPQMGLPAPIMPDTFDEYKNMIEGKTWNKKKFDSMSVYGYVKGIAALYWLEWARQNPQYHILTVSPGATKGTEAAKSESLSPFLAIMFPIMFAVFNMFGGAHSVEVGAKRYVDALYYKENNNEYSKYKSGTFLASVKGASGKVGDQTKVRKQHGAQYGDVAKQQVAYKVLSTYY